LDSDEEDSEILYKTDRWDWKLRNRLFITRLLSEPYKETIWASMTTSQRLAEGVYQSMETLATATPLPLYAREFESMFAQKDFNILPLGLCHRTPTRF